MEKTPKIVECSLFIDSFKRNAYIQTALKIGDQHNKRIWKLCLCLSTEKCVACSRSLSLSFSQAQQICVEQQSNFIVHDALSSPQQLFEMLHFQNGNSIIFIVYFFYVKIVSNLVEFNLSRVKYEIKYDTRWDLCKIMFNDLPIHSMKSFSFRGKKNSWWNAIFNILSSDHLFFLSLFSMLLGYSAQTNRMSVFMFTTCILVGLVG